MINFRRDLAVVLLGAGITAQRNGGAGLCAGMSVQYESLSPQSTLKACCAFCFGIRGLEAACSIHVSKLRNERMKKELVTLQKGLSRLRMAHDVH